MRGPPLPAALAGCGRLVDTTAIPRPAGWRSSATDNAVGVHGGADRIAVDPIPLLRPLCRAIRVCSGEQDPRGGDSEATASADTPTLAHAVRRFFTGTARAMAPTPQAAEVFADRVVAAVGAALDTLAPVSGDPDIAMVVGPYVLRNDATTSERRAAAHLLVSLCVASLPEALVLAAEHSVAGQPSVAAAVQHIAAVVVASSVAPAAVSRRW